MKRLLSIITASAMIAAAAPMVFAAEPDYESLIPDVKNRLDIPEEYTEFSYQGRHSDRDGECYSFQWSKKDSDDHIHAEVSHDGNILNYSTSNRLLEYDYLSADSSTQAKAEEYISKLLKNMEGDIRLEVCPYQYGAMEYYVYVSRNGIEYADSIGNISVGSDGALCSANLSPVVLPDEDISSFVSAEEAYAKYMANAAPNAKYNSYYDDDDKLVIFPVYGISDTKVISATSGEPVELKGRAWPMNQYTETAADVGGSGAAGYKEMSEIEKQEIARVNKFISEQDAVGLIERKLGIKLADDVRSNLFIDENGGTYNFYSYEEDNYVHIVVDAKTSDIIGANFRDVPGNKMTGYDFSDPESVKRLTAYLAPSNAEGYETDTTETDIPDDKSEEGTRLVYKVNGIEVTDLSAHALKTKDGYEFGITPVADYRAAEYAAPDTFIGAENAFKQSDLQLKYAQTENGTEAVYMPSDFTDINAQTGVRVNYRNEEQKKGSEYTYSDIDSHWIKPVAEKLALAGIGYKGGEFKPEESISEALAAEVIGGWRYYKDSEEYDDKTPITRRDAADMIAERLGFEKIVGLDIFKIPYSDTTEDYGSIAVLKGMGIIASDVDVFRPNDNITRAEFIQMIYNAITVE